jgi:hypothetical protein
MARPKRMGAYNALDDLPDEPGPRSGWPRLEPVPAPPPSPSRRRPNRRRAGNALDELLPGPRSLSALDDLLPGPSAPSSQRPGPARRSRSAGRHLEVWNPLDGLSPPSVAPDPGSGSSPARVPAKARVGFRLPADLVEAARDAVAHLAGTDDRTTLTALADRALRTELARLADAHNRGRPFPRRAP